MERIWRDRLAKLAISLACLGIVSLVAAEQWLYVACALLLLAWKGRERIALFLLAAIVLSIFALRLGVAWIPTTYDAQLWKLDGRLGFDPSAYALQVVSQSSLLLFLAKRTYFALPLVMALGLSLADQPTRLGTKLALAAILGFACYFLFPACGPIYYLTDSLAGAPRNAMPSLHLAWALLLWREARSGSLAWEVGTDFFLIFTVVATLGSGEHYLIDLLAAVPFWLAIEYLVGAASMMRRYRPVPMGACAQELSYK